MLFMAIAGRRARRAGSTSGRLRANAARWAGGSRASVFACRRPATPAKHLWFLASVTTPELARLPLISFAAASSSCISWATTVHPVAAYPTAFARVHPVCESDDLTRCSRDAIVNAFDNAVVHRPRSGLPACGVITRAGRTAVMLALSRTRGVAYKAENIAAASCWPSSK